MIKGKLKQAVEIVKALRKAKAADPTLTDKDAFRLAFAHCHTKEEANKDAQEKEQPDAKEGDK